VGPREPTTTVRVRTGGTDRVVERPDVTVRVLGGFTVTIDGAPVDDAAWSRRQASVLVKLLALAPGHRLHREQVVDALWPELSPAEAAPRLHKCAHFTRAATGVRDAIVLAG